jgi:hypothetical protein
MQALKVRFYNGHFIDTETQQMVIPSSSVEYILVGESESFKSKDILSEIGESLDSQAMIAFIKKKYPNDVISKLMSADEKLFFRVGISRPVNRMESTQYIFLCNLLEDLYIHCIPTKKSEN